MRNVIKEALAFIVTASLVVAISLSPDSFLSAQEVIKSAGRPAAPANFISLDFQNASLKDILKIFSQQSGLNFVASDVVSDKKITLYLDKVSVQDALYNIVEANQLSYKQAEGSNIFIVSDKQKEEEAPTITKVYVLKYARLSTSTLENSNSALSGTTTGLSGSLSATSGKGATGGGGGGTSSKGINKIVEKLLSPRGSLAVDERTNSLIITDIPAQFERIEAIMSKLDVPTPQVIIEAEILEVNKETIDKLGIEFGGTNGTIFNASGAGTTEPFPFASRARAIGSSASSVSLGTLSFNSLTAVMQALASDSDTKILARPRIITLNNESAVINITAQTAVASLTETTSAGGSAVTTTATPERLTTGVILTITPQINENGYITMLVAPEVTIPIASEFFPDKFVDPQTRSARSIVRIKDNDTIVIGGLLKEDDSKVVRKVPILGDIPILGLLFRKMSNSVKNKELVVFITPHIIYDEKTGKKETASIAAAPKKVETKPLVTKTAPVVKEVSPPKKTEQKPIPPKGAVKPETREDVIERALDQLSQNHNKKPNGNAKPTNQI